MPIINRVADLQPDIVAWRRDLHAHPELMYEVHRTAAFVAERLREFGCDKVVTEIGRTGVVGIIKGRLPADGHEVRSIGLRADMDALPIEEATELPYASKKPGVMHACGHDGHTAMLLGAARYLAETRNFAGTAVLIFQPAEEGGGGAKAMLDDRPAGPVSDRSGLRHAQRPRPAGRLLRDAARPDHGRDGFDRPAHRGPRRPRRAAAQIHRLGAGRRATGHRAAVDRVAHRGPAGSRRGVGVRVPRRQCPQRHPADRRR